MVRFLGFEILKRSEAESIADIRKEVTRLRDENLKRPMMDFFQSTLTTDSQRTPYLNSLSIQAMYDIKEMSDTLRIIINSRKGEIFRNGLEVKERFVAKCMKCKKEFKHEIEICDECGSDIIQHPDPMNKQNLEKRMDKVNENGQSLQDVLKCNEEDICTVDDAYLLVGKDYLFNENGEIIGGNIGDTVRLHPNHIRLLVDTKGRPGRTMDGKKIYVCPEHRDKEYTDGAPDKCNICGKKLYRAYFKTTPIGDVGGVIYYLKGEVIHWSYFGESLSYGKPPMIPIWQKVMTLLYMDEYLKDYYGEKRPPKGVFLVNTTNQGSLQKAWDWVVEKTRINPHFIHPLAIESNSKRGSTAQFIDFMRNLNDMEYIEARNEMRRQIGAVYGVLPIFQGDVSTGGVKNEGMQITVTNRAISTSQDNYNRKVLRPWVEQLGIDDYDIVVVPNEQRDELTELQIEAAKIANAQAMQALGFKVTLNEEKEFEFEPQDETQQQNPNSGNEELPNVPKAPEGKLPLPKIEEQRFSGEPTHAHSGGEDTQGAPEDLTRSVKKNVPEEEDDLTEKDFESIVKFLYKGILRKESNVNIEKDDAIPKEKLEEVARNLYRKKFDNISVKMSKRIKNRILKMFRNNKSIDEIVKSIQRIAGEEMTPAKAETIARTESQSLLHKLREVQYEETDPEGKNLYKWIGPTDKRTTKICKNIQSRTARGVSMAKLKSIIDEESKKGGFKPRDLVPHVNCRHSFVRVFR